VSDFWRFEGCIVLIFEGQTVQVFFFGLLDPWKCSQRDLSKRREPQTVEVIIFRLLHPWRWSQHDLSKRREPQTAEVIIFRLIHPWRCSQHELSKRRELQTVQVIFLDRLIFEGAQNTSFRNVGNHIESKSFFGRLHPWMCSQHYLSKGREPLIQDTGSHLRRIESPVDEFMQVKISFMIIWVLVSGFNLYVKLVDPNDICVTSYEEIFCILHRKMQVTFSLRVR
jgi:hypothetical protein